MQHDAYKKDAAIDKLLFEITSSPVYIKGYTLTTIDINTIRRAMDETLSKILQQVREDE